MIGALRTALGCGSVALIFSYVGAGFATTTFSQVPYTLGSYTVNKLTRSFVRSQLNVDLFYQISGVASHTYWDPNDGTKVDYAVVLDPSWNRFVYSTSYDSNEELHDIGDYGSGANQFNTPSSLALSAIGNLFIADTGNGRVVVYSWLATGGPNTNPRRFDYELQIPGGSYFTYPSKVVWDDNGSPTNNYDEVVWVLDSSNAKIAGYHFTLVNGVYGYSPYAAIDLRQQFTGALPRCPVALTKGRAYTAPNQSGSYCTTELYVFDSANASFLILNVPHSSGFVTTSAITAREVASPVPDVVFSDITTDAWGNVIGIDPGASSLYKFTKDVGLLDTYGSYGFGTDQMASPRSLNVHTENPPGSGAYQITANTLVAEDWSDQSGLQAIRLGVGIGNLAVSMSSGGAASINFTLVDHSNVQVQIRSGGTVIRTLSPGTLASGARSVTWDGRNDSGSPVVPCLTYTAVVSATGLYVSPSSASASIDFQYRPLGVATLTLTSNVPGAIAQRDGQNLTLSGGGAALACSLCTTHSVGTAPTQNVTGTRYCFNYWSNAGFRKHSVEVRRDTTISLNLTVYAGPTTIPAGATLYDDAYDCKSPYLFQGSATLTTSSPTDTFHTWGNVKFRMPKWPAQVSEKALLTIARPIVGKGLRFESVDSTSTSGVELWEGVRFAAGATSIVLDSCETRSAANGISTESPTLSYAFITRSKFESNKNSDLSLGFDPSSNPVARITWSRFTDPTAVTISVGGSSLTPVGTATITDNTFTNLGSNGSLRVIGGWQGPIEQNNFTVNKAGTAVKLLRYLTYASPAVYLYHNTFASFISPGSYAVEAPALGGGVTQVNAQNNDWSYYTSDQIAQLLVHGGTRAIVAYQPWTPSGGGGGGGGGGGCPFVLSRTDTGYEVENSILGRSEVMGSMVEDACPLRSSVTRDGTVHLRVAELESDTDVIDRIGLGAVEVPNGYELSTDEGGSPVLVQWPDAPAEELARSSKISAFISPVAPGSAYSGMQGDSLDLRVPDSPGTTPGKRRIGINMIPKPPEASTQPGAGVVIRASTEQEGDRWVTIGRLLPREHWSTETIGLGSLDGGIVRRLRLVWQSQHTLGRIGLVSTAEAKVTAVPALSAHHSNGTDVSDAIRTSDRQTITLRPGEHVDLAFDVREVPITSKLVLLAHGRYFAPGVEPAPEVPAAYFLGQNRPNPFNPHTTIEYGTPTLAKVSIRVFDVSGRLVRTLVNQDLPAGFHRADWDGRSQSGSQVSSGIYFYELRANSFSQKRRMILLR